VTRREKSSIALRAALTVAVCVVVAYLSLVAAFSWVPPVWFGRPNSGATTLVVAAALTALCVLSYRAQTRERPGAIPGGVIAILATSSAALAFGSYFRCHDANHFPVFTALIWTIGTVRGNSSEYFLGNGRCPKVTPAALDIARTAGQFVLYVAVITILVSVLAAEIDRVRIRYARSVTAIVDVDDDSRSMVTAVAQTLKKEKQSQLALIVAANQVNGVRDLRGEGARIRATDLDKLDRLELLPLWKKTRQLYLLSASPTTNLRRLAAIEQRLRAMTRRRLPLIVRIDDPWQAESWRTQRLGGSDTLWAADAVGIHEATAAHLLHRIISTGQITRIAVCGSSPLTLALCANLARRRLERGYYTPPEAPPLPALTIVANNAEEYRKDIDFHHRQLGFPRADWLAAAGGALSLASLTALITAENDAQNEGDTEAEKDAQKDGDADAETDAPTQVEKAGHTVADQDGDTEAQKVGDTEAGKEAQTDAEKDGHPGAEEEKDAEPDIENPTVAVIFALPPGQGGADAMLGTRLAARFPNLAIFVLDPKTDDYQDTIAPIVGQLRTFRPAMDVPANLGHDRWERAAILIHERFAAQAGHHSDVTKPWAELAEFYRGSNRRTVRNTLWMVEKVAGHTWDTFGGVPDQPISADLAEAPPLERLAAIGFDHDTAMAMAAAEHEDWVRYYQRWGWRYGPKRDSARKERPDLVHWQTLVERNPEAVEVALNSLATTLYSLRELGFRSRPLWKRYRRTASVTAKRRWKPWSWTSESGHTMHASAGGWEVSDGDRRRWSVRNDAFRSSYKHTDGNRWERIGVVFARPASDGETIASLEGPTVAAAGDWVIKGTQGEQWVVPGDKFAGQYEAVTSLDAEDSVDAAGSADAEDAPASEAVDSA